MMKSNSHGTKNTVANELTVQRTTKRIPNIGGKIFRLTSESASRTR